jgi:hypothetical protein
MRRLILLAGALILLAAAGVMTLEFRTTMTVLAQPADAGQLAAHLRDMRKEMALP